MPTTSTASSKGIFAEATNSTNQTIMVRAGTVRFKNVSSCLNINIYSYLETSGGQSSNLYFNVAHFFNTSVN